jgi:type IV fimbrial biogenesis protein FimT
LDIEEMMQRRFRPPGHAAQAPLGFTLIELVITMAVLALLVVMVLPDYSLVIQNAQMRTAAESIQSGLQLARAEALRQNTQVSFSLNGNDWSVDTVTPVANIQRRSNAVATPNAAVASTQNQIIFNGLGRVVPPANMSGACVGAGGGFRCLNISVLSGGQTRLCDPHLPVTDAQGC